MPTWSLPCIGRPRTTKNGGKKRSTKLIVSPGNFVSKSRPSRENPLPYNQLAWLVANTEGDQDEALKMSLKSLELRPATAGFLDTLAHCYYARKEYAEAVKHQAMAVELDPYSPALARMLKKFRAAHARQQESPSENEASPPEKAPDSEAPSSQSPDGSG